MKKFIPLFALLMIISTTALSAGGSSGGGGAMAAPMNNKSPRELAIASYNKGLKSRDKAWRLLQDAQEIEDRKKIAKLEKKALKAFKIAANRFRTAVKHEPGFYQAYGSLGYALRKLGDFEESLAAYNQSLELKPDYTEAIEYRAEANLALGNTEATKSAYIRLMQLDRSRADELMAAIQVFLRSPTERISPQALESLRVWVAERIQLSQATQDLSGVKRKDWSPN